jgi:hypothetical protein
MFIYICKKKQKYSRRCVMSKKLFFIIPFVLLAALAAPVLAVTRVWTNTSGDGLWTTASNWSPAGVPVINPDKAEISQVPGPLITTGMTAEAKFVALSDGAPADMNMTGGTLNIGPPFGDSWFIIGYGASDVGTFRLDGGNVNCFKKVYVGYEGLGTIDMNSGNFDIGVKFGIGYHDAGGTTGEGHVYLRGGTITAADFEMRYPTGAIGTLDISGGTLHIDGDKQTIVQGYIDNGWIIAYGGMGNVIVTYASGTTTLTGIIDPNKAKLPYPTNNAVDVPPYLVLTWTPGDNAAAHDIYFGTDANSVRDANTTITLGVYKGQQTLDANYYDPCGIDELGQICYWRVDEVNGPNIYKGNVWHFTVANYALVDDFEEYVDTTDMLASWSNAGTGAALSLATSNGHDEAQSMKFDYDNSSEPNYSEAQTIDIDPNWTIAGVLAIDIWYKGDAANAAEQMYVALEDSDGNPVAVYDHSNPNAAKAADWQPWRIELADFTGVNLGNIKKFYIGFGDRSNPTVGGTGTVYFDDIRLHPSRCVYQPIEDLNDDCFVDFKDFAIMAGNWLSD